MTDDMRLLLRILLEQELREAEPEMQRPRKKREAEREDEIDYAPAESRGKTKRTKDTMKEERAEDLQQARSDMYSTHENVAYNMKKVPIWEKYALSLSEAAEYFHIGTRRLRQIIAKDKYAKYLIWNGGRVFFKRKMFEEYLNNEVGKSKLSTMFAYLTDKFNLKVLMIDKDLQATLTKDLAKTFKVELPRVNFYEGLKNGNLASSIVHLTDNLDLIPGTFDLMLLPKLTRSWTFENESRLLATLLAPLKSDYDLIIIDTVPTPSVYTNNAIVASDYVMIPLQAEEESTNNIQNYISYLIDLQEQFNPGLDMIGFVPYLVDTDSATIKSNLEELYKQHKEDNLVFQNIIKRSNKVSTWSKNGITEHKGYDKKVLSMYENVFFEMLERIIQLENEKE